MSWQFGLLAVVVLPLAVFVAAVFWPERASKDRTVRSIRERIEQEQADG
ncbi:hypothetical protein [Nocardia mexicana]|uniref:Uncharacterized protein n=1 Tax=Nocardia mexicana TaxID=279262 RepID=A0A370H7U2_9NOCA|nr:hypothetical protein [Nocardia mexicana]RDI52745.1 hypothetical protein DFR68_103130 [Nocardia mexicana]